jgi:hypothetical protein
MKAWVFFGLLTLALSRTADAGDIRLGTPLVSGEVVRFASRQEISRTALSSTQLQGVANWLERHQSGWAGMITPASPSEPALMTVNLRHSDGTITSLSVLTRVDGARYLRLTGPGKMAYDSFFGLVKSWAATRSLSVQELTAFEDLVSAR